MSSRRSRRDFLKTVAGATAATWIVANADDALVMAHVDGAIGRMRTFGESADAAIRATSVVDRGFDGTSAQVTTPGGPLALQVPLAGRAQLFNVLAAIAVATIFDVPAADIVRRVASMAPVARRGASVLRRDGIRVIDDSYNASPAAVDAMLAALAATPAAGRRVAMIGEMRELGDAAFALHVACGRAAARAKVDLLVVVGGADANGLVEGAEDGGLDASRIHRYDTSTHAADRIEALLQPRDMVLVKGSRGTRMDVVADRLLGVA
jgi:UDP-N-acetylmuramoyl-tripeptide--D-alanyl-D-alanine ligase